MSRWRNPTRCSRSSASISNVFQAIRSSTPPVESNSSGASATRGQLRGATDRSACQSTRRRSLYRVALPSAVKGWAIYADGTRMDAAHSAGGSSAPAFRPLRVMISTLAIVAAVAFLGLAIQDFWTWQRNFTRWGHYWLDNTAHFSMLARGLAEAMGTAVASGVVVKALRGPKAAPASVQPR